MERLEKSSLFFVHIFKRIFRQITTNGYDIVFVIDTEDKYILNKLK